MAAQRLFGYAADEVIGKPNTILIPPDRFDAAPQDRSHRRLRQTRVACPLLLQRQRQAGDADWRRRRGHLPIDYVYWSPDLAQLVSNTGTQGQIWITESASQLLDCELGKPRLEDRAEGARRLEK